MSAREIAVAAPLAIGVIVLGVYPSLATDMFGETVSRIVESYQASIAAVGAGVETASTAAHH